MGTKKQATVYDLSKEAKKRQDNLLDLGYSINDNPEDLRKVIHLQKILDFGSKDEKPKSR
jgi:hypothetical protein